MILSTKSIIKIFSFLQQEYKYTISNIEVPGFNGVVLITYTHETFFDILIEQERGYLSIKCNVNQELVPLHLIYQSITSCDSVNKAEYNKRSELTKGVSDIKKYLEVILNTVAH